jgi:hypothetical protein
MAASAVGDPAERWHLVGDVPALLVVAGVLTFSLVAPSKPRRPTSAFAGWPETELPDL